MSSYTPGTKRENNKSNFCGEELCPGNPEMKTTCAETSPYNLYLVQRCPLCNNYTTPTSLPQPRVYVGGSSLWGNQSCPCYPQYYCQSYNPYNRYSSVLPNVCYMTEIVDHGCSTCPSNNCECCKKGNCPCCKSGIECGKHDQGVSCCHSDKCIMAKGNWDYDDEVQENRSVKSDAANRSRSIGPPKRKRGLTEDRREAPRSIQKRDSATQSLGGTIEMRREEGRESERRM